MKLFVWTLGYWDHQAHAQLQAPALNRWLGTVERLFRPQHVYVACGTWSDPVFSPLPTWVPIINAGVKKDRPYDCVWWNYAGSAFTAALSYAVIRPDWDLLILHDTDVLVGAVDFDALLNEFINRPETFLCANWHGRPGGGSITVWKREGAVKWINQRRRANLIERGESDPDPMLLEDEFGEIYKGQWWNPWPEFETMRQDYGQRDAAECEALNEQVMRWPFVRLPHPSIVERYTAEQTSLAKPVKTG